MKQHPLAIRTSPLRNPPARSVHPSVEVLRLLSDLERLDERVSLLSRRVRRSGELRDFSRWALACASRWFLRRSLDAQLHQLAMTAAD